MILEEAKLRCRGSDNRPECWFGKTMRIIIVGTLPPPVCGTSVSLQHLIEDLEQRQNVAVSVINTQGIRGRGILGVCRLCVVFWSLLTRIPQGDTLALHLNPYAIPWIGPVAVIVCRLCHTRLLIRLFGGQCFSEFSGIRGRLFHWVIRHCDVYLAQTKAQVESAKMCGIHHVGWFPTSRPSMPAAIALRDSCRRFLFVGWVSKSKGIPDLVNAGRSLTRRDLEIDVYGSFSEGLTERDFDGQQAVRYRGIIDAGKAMVTMASYDALILPTQWQGEGYPGVILEAFHVGIPVICTRWRFIPEVVDESCGILIEPGKSDELAQAIELLASDDKLFRRLQLGAREKALAFSTLIWTDRFLQFCEMSTN